MPYRNGCGEETDGAEVCSLCEARTASVELENPCAVETRTQSGAPVVDNVQTCSSRGTQIVSEGVGDIVAASSDSASEVRGVFDSTRLCLGKKYANFSGKASRSEFWLFTFGSALIVAVVWAVVVAFCGYFIVRLGLSSGVGNVLRNVGLLLTIAACLYLLTPRLAIGVRRFHDVGLSGWIYVVLFFVQGFLEAAIVNSYFFASFNFNKFRYIKPERRFVDYLPVWFWFAVVAVVLIALFNLIVFLKRGTRSYNKDDSASAKRTE